MAGSPSFCNPLRQAWQEGRQTVNGWLAIPSPVTAEVMAHQGWDSLTFDMQHGLVDYTDTIPMLAAISTTSTVAMARIPWLDESIIMKMLDAGCHGIICPMVNNAQDAARFVRICQYPPEGIRSFGPIRTGLYAGPEYYKTANGEVLKIAMVETREAVDNLESILSVDGLSGVYVGPADLSMAYGCTPKFDQEERPVVEAIEKIVATAREKGKFVGVHNLTPGYALRMAKLGTNFVTIASDLRFMTAAAADAVKTFRSGLESQ
jgi:4-hydroxy-2-oxoheptanedioate aldolase